MFIGNLGDDPVVRYLPDGEAVCQFSMATSVDFKDRESGKIKEYTEWHNIVAFKKKAEILGEYLKKGSKVHIEAKHRTRKYSDSNGVDRFWSEFVVVDFTLLGNPRDNQTLQPVPQNTSIQAEHQTLQAASHSNSSANTPSGLPDDVRDYLASPHLPTDSFDDDIPF